MNDSLRPMCMACGAQTGAPVCAQCQTLFGLEPEMTPVQALHHMTLLATNMRGELEELEDARDDGDRDAEPLLDAVRAWHKARSSANRDQRLLDTTEADLLDESRRRFEW